MINYKVPIDKQKFFWNELHTLNLKELIDIYMLEWIPSPNLGIWHVCIHVSLFPMNFITKKWGSITLYLNGIFLKKI